MLMVLATITVSYQVLPWCYKGWEMPLHILFDVLVLILYGFAALHPFLGL
jgi:hypothetical protein